MENGMSGLDLNKRRRMVDQAADLTAVARQLSERDRDYYDEHQWTSDEIAVLQKRKQPVITINRIKRKVDAMIGIEQRSRVDPRAYPRNPQDEQAADAATKALVYVEDQTRFDAKKSAAFENLLIEGYGGVEVIAEPRRTRRGVQMDVTINRLRWEEIFFDPHSREKDFSDAAYLGTQRWMTVDAALDLYGASYQGGPEALAGMLEATFRPGSDGETYEDRPFEAGGQQWVDRRQRRVRIAQMYYRHSGQWHLAIFCGGGDIWADVSPYQDEDGEPACPIILMTAYIDRENRRYGLVRGMISQQDEINKRRSKLLHQLNSRQTIGVKGAVDSVADMKRELALPDGHVAVNVEAFDDAMRAGVKPFEIVQQADQTSGQFALLQEAKAEIDLTGPNPALIGQTREGASGRAIMAQQQAGLVELAPIYDSLRDWTIRVYRAIWERIRQFWTEERWVRVTDDANGAQFVGLNVVRGYAQVIDMRTGQPMAVPQIENPVAEMDVDIVIEDSPDYVTLRQEEFEQLSDMAGKGVPIPPEMLIEASSIRNKQRILETLQQQRAAAEQAQAQQAQAAMQMEQAKVAATVQKDQATAQKSMADAGKTVVETRRLALGFGPAAGV